jgi:hypothetical protein
MERGGNPGDESTAVHWRGESSGLLGLVAPLLCSPKYPADRELAQNCATFRAVGDGVSAKGD